MQESLVVFAHDLGQEVERSGAHHHVVDFGQRTELLGHLPHVALTVPLRVAFFVYEIAAVSAVIQLGLALPMVVYFHRLGISGLSANVLVVPLMGVAVPAGFVAVFTGWTWAARFAGVEALREEVGSVLI